MKSFKGIKMPSGESPYGKIKWISISAIIIVFITLITYRSAFRNTFVDWDDFTYVVNNELVRNPGETYFRDLFTTPVASNYHPLTMLSLRLNNNTCEECPEGISPLPFIAGNVILHLVNALLVFLLVWLLSGRQLTASLLAALLFAVHPMHVESVAWISERKDVLHTMFFLAGIICWVRFREKSRNIWLLSAFLLFVFSCLSKATAVVFPVVLILIDFWLEGHENPGKPLKALGSVLSVKKLMVLLPFFIVSLFTGLMAYRIQSGENFLGILNEGTGTPDVVNELGPFTFIQRLKTASYGFVSYLLKFVFPSGLSALNPFPELKEFGNPPFRIVLTGSLVLTILIATIAIVSLRKTRLIFFGLGFYFVTVALVLQFVTVGMAIKADRYTYIPYIGLAFILVMFISGNSNIIRKSGQIILFIVVVIFSVLSDKQVRTWKNTETLWTNVIEKYPDTELPRRSRAKYYSKLALNEANEIRKRELEDKALQDFLVAAEKGSIHPDVYEGLGVIYASKKNFSEAQGYLTTAISLDSLKGSTFYNRALVRTELGLKNEAIEDYTSALRANPEKALEIINNRSNLLLETGRYIEAIRDLDYLITRDRNNFNLYFNRAISKLSLNDKAGAAEDLQRALLLNPEDLEIRNLLEKIKTINN
jgi:hypothetical protein